VDNRTFRVKLIQSNSKTFKPKFLKTNTTIDTKIDTGTTKPSEEIVYDEIVYYDGGGVEGYGDN